MTNNNTNIEKREVTAETSTLVRVGISQGDTNGVGYELILKTFSDSLMYDICIPIIFGHQKIANYHRRALEMNNVSFHFIHSPEEAVPGKLNFVNLSDEDVPVDFGVQSAEAGHAAYESLEQAVEAYKTGDIDVLITAPINKASIQSTNFRFVGHTEYLQNRFGNVNEPLMVLCNNLMRVALVTTHLPISEVAFAINQERVEQKIKALYETLMKDFNISAPRVAVLALNPHAGDNGVLGSEENEMIAPAIKSLAEAGMPCYGPYAADGFFGAALYKHFDGILAMYHDQGLTPFKALSMDNGVNFTAGLPLVRTSPDHGTAYDIAGRGIAHPDSFREAIYAAIDIFRNRQSYEKSHANPLPKIYQERKER